MKNIEIKATLENEGAAEEKARQLSGDRCGKILRQIDTFFRMMNGRLKLREELSDGRFSATLISYLRPDQSGPKASQYELAHIEEPEALKRVLALVPGTRCTVIKDRVLYLHKNARIHIDRVEGLGSFIEFEVVLSDDDTEEEGRAFAEELLKEFDINQEALITAAYADMLYPECCDKHPE